MGAPTNTFRTASAVGLREQLSDVVSRITPEDTPIYSDMEKSSCKGIHPEWETDTLATPAVNSQEEGDDYDFDEITPPVRLGNYTQIFRKTGIVSGTQEVVEEAGNIQKVKHQKLKKGVELRKDLEFALVSNTASVGGSTRYLGSLPSWIATNVSRGGSGANGGFSSVTGLTVAATSGTQRAFTKTIMDSVAQQGYNSGANFRTLYVSPYVKSVFVSFMSLSDIAPFRYAVDDGKKNSIIANADVYEGPFGKLMIKPDRVMAGSATLARNAFFIDPEMVSFEWLRKIHEDKDLAKTGDNEKFTLIGEGTLKVHNEAGLGVAADLYGLTAST